MKNREIENGKQSAWDLAKPLAEALEVDPMVMLDQKDYTKQELRRHQAAYRILTAGPEHPAYAALTFVLDGISPEK